jgi:hypothetical protein
VAEGPRGMAEPRRSAALGPATRRADVVLLRAGPDRAAFEAADLTCGGSEMPGDG